jgi:hypothetical protein
MFFLMMGGAINIPLRSGRQTRERDQERNYRGATLRVRTASGSDRIVDSTSISACNRFCRPLRGLGIFRGDIIPGLRSSRYIGTRSPGATICRPDRSGLVYAYIRIELMLALRLFSFGLWRQGSHAGFFDPFQRHDAR